MALKTVTLKEIYRNAFGSGLEGLKPDQKQFAEQSFAAYGDNFESAPDQMADMRDFNRMMVQRLDEGQKQQLQEKTSYLAGAADIASQLVAPDSVLELVIEVAGAAMQREATFDPDVAGAAIEAAASSGVLEIAGEAAGAVLQGAGAVLEGAGEVVGGIVSSLDF